MTQVRHSLLWRCCIAVGVSWLGANEVRGESFCMSAAESYYQQLYCEVKARGAGGALPSFSDFRNNDETVQALLLKSAARRLGIRVVMPSKTTRDRIAAIDTTSRNVGGRLSADAIAKTGRQDTAASVAAEETVRGECRFERDGIRCDGNRYSLIGNLRNEKLDRDALAAENRMALPAYRAALTDSEALNRYLLSAYRRYIEKMLAIGLGGATMSYGKFTHLFRDLAARGVSFSQRFETMYEFLKKDKRHLAVSERVRINRGLRLSDCGDVSDALIVCSTAGRNYVYQRAN